MVWKANMALRQLKVNPVIAREEDYEKAIGSFEAVTARFPAPAVRDTSELGDEDSKLLARISGRALLQAARLRGERSQHDKALALCDRVLHEYPFDIAMCLEAQYLKGTIMESAHRVGDAIAEYEKVVENFPPTVRGGGFPIQQVLDLPLRIGTYYQSLGDSVRARQRFETARRYYEGVIREYPASTTSAMARLKLSTTYSSQRRYADAIRCLEEMSREPSLVDDQKAEVLFTIGSLHEDGLRDHASSLATFEKLLREYGQSPIAPRAQLMIGTVHREVGRIEQAVAELRKVREQYPSDVENGSAAAFQLAQIYEGRDDWEEALQQYNETTASYPRTRYGLLAPLAVAQHYRRMKDVEAADLALERAAQTYHGFMEKNPDSPLVAVAQEYVSQARLLQQNWQEAVQELVRYGDRFPQLGNAPLALLSAAQISREKLGKPDLAAEILRKITERYPNTTVSEQAQRQLGQLPPAS
jgi:tetratricopeptide (TPR) repeat protein